MVDILAASVERHRAGASSVRHILVQPLLWIITCRPAAWGTQARVALANAGRGCRLAAGNADC